MILQILTKLYMYTRMSCSVNFVLLYLSKYCSFDYFIFKVQCGDCQSVAKKMRFCLYSTNDYDRLFVMLIPQSLLWRHN